jgi:transposase
MELSVERAAGLRELVSSR